MARHWIEYTAQCQPSPMTFWVHRASDRKARTADADLPAPPQAIPGKGFPTYFVRVDGFTFRFASLHELRECVAVLSRKLLPTTRALSRGRDAGPNSHWLSRLPATVKPWSYRERAVRHLSDALADFETETG